MMLRNLRQYFLLLMVLMLTSAMPACGGLEHIRALREAQDEFSKLAGEDNSTQLQILFPSDAYLRNLVSGGNEKTLADVNSQAVRMRGYFELYQRLNALITREGAALKQDKLYANAQALRLFSLWRATFYYHLLVAKDVAGLDSYQMQSLPNVLAETKAISLNDKDAQFGPRDAFYIHTMPSLMRYELAYIRYFSMVRDKNKTAADITRQLPAICNQMAQAADDLQKISDEDVNHLELYRLMSSYVMLKTAHDIGMGADIGRPNANIIVNGEMSAENFQAAEEFVGALQRWDARRKNLRDSDAALFGLLPGGGSIAVPTQRGAP